MNTAPMLKTQRLVLRALTNSDIDKLAYLLHPEIQKDAGPFMPHSINDLSTHFERINGDTTWLITLNANIIGDIGVFSKQNNETGEMAWYIDPKYWRNGYAHEAGKAIIEFMFDMLSYKKLTAEIELTNVSSRKLAEKLGFKIENEKRDTNLYGKATDVCYYSIYNHTN